MLEAIHKSQIRLLPRVQLIPATIGSRRYLKMKSMNVVTNPNPKETKNCWLPFRLVIPNGLNMKRNRKINNPNTRIVISLSLEASNLRNGVLKGFIIVIYLQTNL